MSSSADVEGILGEAIGLEREYEWLEASGLYEQALRLVDEEDYFRKGEIQEKNGRCLHRAAFQAGSREEFLERLRKAVEAYEVVCGLYGRVADERGAGWALRCGAVARYLEHWIATDPTEKKRLLDECLNLERNALEAFWDDGDKLEYCRTYGELPELFWHREQREYIWKTEPTREIFARGQQIIEEGIRWGERAVEALSELGDPYEAARAYMTLGICCSRYQARFVEELEEREQHLERAVDILRKATEASEDVGKDYLIGLSYIWLGIAREESEESKKLVERALVHAEKTRDIYLIGLVLGWLVQAGFWVRVVPEEDPDKNRATVEEIMALYDEALRHLSILSFYGYEGGVICPPGGYSEYFYLLSSVETDSKRKVEFLDKSLETGEKALKIAEDSGTNVGYVRHVLSKALTARARLESEINKKKSLLRRAIENREVYVTETEQLYPYNYWNVGIGYDYLAEIKAELAYTEADLDIKRRFLEEAVSDMEKGLQHFYKVKPYFEIGRTHLFAGLYPREMRYAALLTRLYGITNEPGYLRKAIGGFYKVIESAGKVDFFSRIAESYWEIAKAQATLGEHVEAAENFKRASESYKKAAEKIPQLKDFYQEYASYMLAWSEFEKAKQSHASKKYAQAKEHYETTANLHKSTERWSYLAPNYLAWARLEEAEDLSRREETEEARDLFQQAMGLFKEAKGSIEIKLRTIQDEDERELLVSLAQASDVRRDYCIGRTALEEGRILDRQGDHLASSRRYGQAAERFQNVIDAMERESDRRELEPILYLCRAWEKMMMAEARTSPGLYDEAAELFEQARMHATDQSTSILAQAHCSFCRALEAGTGFELTRKTESFSEAKRHIEAATSYYLRAGVRTASDYTRATSRLLDAYMYTYRAQTETDPPRKAQFYRLSENLLQDSAGFFLKAKHPEKSEDVRRVLENIREEKQMAITLAELLDAPAIASTTTSFSTPTPTQEQAVGLERFENADVQANLILGKGDVKVGDDIDLEIELVNAGKAPAQLIKVEDIIPDGFEVSSAPDICRVEDSYLDMKGRTLNPLKTAELKMVLRPLDKGTYQLRPRVLYLDEAGKYRSHEPEPATVVVKELGIRGWLRGPTR